MSLEKELEDIWAVINILSNYEQFNLITNELLLYYIENISNDFINEHDVNLEIKYLRNKKEQT